MRVVNRGVGVVLVFSFPCCSNCSSCLIRRAQLPFRNRDFFPAHQLLFEQSEGIRTPMMSCMTFGSRLGRNAPHLSDDPTLFA